MTETNSTITENVAKRKFEEEALNQAKKAKENQNQTKPSGDTILSGWVPSTIITKAIEALNRRNTSIHPSKKFPIRKMLENKNKNIKKIKHFIYMY